MKKVCSLLALAAACLALVSFVRAQQPPRPGPEFDKLKKLVGTWDATMKFMGQESKGVMTYKLGLGGLWLLSSYEGDFGGQKFEGHGMDTYDAASGKYVGIWADSMVTRPVISEGTFDKDGKVVTMEGTSPGPDGKPAKFKMTSEMKDEDSMVSTMSMFGSDGKEQGSFTISYKRRK
jgi:hypothetical protein